MGPRIFLQIILYPKSSLDFLKYCVLYQLNEFKKLKKVLAKFLGNPKSKFSHWSTFFSSSQIRIVLPIKLPIELVQQQLIRLKPLRFLLKFSFLVPSVLTCMTLACLVPTIHPLSLWWHLTSDWWTQKGRKEF